MASKKQKRKNRAIALAEQANTAAKSYTGGGYYGGFASMQPDMRADEFGAAQAYTFNVAVSAAVEFWERWSDGIPWRIKAEGSDTVLIDSTMRRFPRDVAGATFAEALKTHEKSFKHSWFKSVAFSDAMYGETYTRFLCNDYRVPKLLEWLNPLAVEPDTTLGYIREYRYSGTNEYIILNPQDVAYRIAKRDASNDLRGQSRVISAIDALNLEAANKRAFKSYFKNNMLLGGVISPTSAETSLAPNQIMKMEDDLARNNKGSANAGKWVIAPTNMNITPFSIADAEKNYAIIQPLRDEILMAMGVFPQLVGDPSNASYDNTADMKRQWWETWGIPYAKEIMGYINDLILPVLEPYTNIYFEFDFTAYEVENPDVVSADFDAGYIDMYQAAELRGYEGDTDFKGIYKFNGQPMAKEIILKLANTIPSQYALDYANAASAGQAPNVNASSASGVVTPIAPDVPASNPIPIAIENIDDGFGDDIETKSITLTSDTDAHGDIHITVTGASFASPEHTHDLPPIVDTPNIAALDELQAWRKFYSNGKSLKRQFEQVALRGDLGDSIQAALETHDKQTILDAFKTAHDRLSIKAIQATRLDFEGDFDELLKRARAEKMGRVQWASAMRVIGRRYGTKAYIDGMADGGVEDEPSEEDRIAINDLVSQQSPYITELGNVLFKEDGISDAQADGKAAMWYNKSIQPLYQAGLESSALNSLFEWVYGDTEHCETCRRLNGQRHRLKGWKANYLPQADNLDCHGFNCECRLVKAKGRARGTY